MNERFEKFKAALAENLPEFNVKFKDESTFMKIIGKILFFNKTFMTGFVTTIGYTVYWPNRKKVDLGGQRVLATLAHEYRHAKDAKKTTPILFGFLYLLPQILALPGLMSLILIPLLIFGVVSWSWWMLSLMLTILFILPIPAYFRMRYEVNGYIMSMFIKYKLLKELGMDKIDIRDVLYIFIKNINKNFTELNYYYMWPFGIEERLSKKVEKILSGEIIKEDKIYQEVANALKKSKI